LQIALVLSSAAGVNVLLGSRKLQNKTLFIHLWVSVAWFLWYFSCNVLCVENIKKPIKHLNKQTHVDEFFFNVYWVF